MAKRSSPGFSGCRFATRISSAMTEPVPSIFAPRTVTPSVSSSTTRMVISSLACSPQALERSPCGLMMR